MADQRELVLARLQAIGAAVPGIRTSVRNVIGISENRRPALVVLDADEAVEEADLSGSRPFDAPMLVVMSPEIFLMVSAAPEDIGTQLNIMRARVMRAVLQDAELRGIVGTNGAVRYAGCGTALAAGRSMEGEMAMTFAIRYALKPAELEG
jgi:hypothetical protein